MKCPACFNELTEIQVGSVLVDVCQGACGGIWFDAFELQRLDEHVETAGEHLLDIQRDAQIVVDTKRKRVCPRCPDIKLHRHFFSAKRRIEVDECPSCGGYWLDAGELAQIRTEQSEEDIPKSPGLSPQIIRYLYRLQTERQKPS